ncbi:uncharacterized protein AC631_02904 [Debaryomyces fabryi]|uniref:Zn(2)-C6 fungal-type domain-containing protein n=1 Tax=Debaryomyces fabryi TaxID=58627 RepID=A0A0V1PYK1_9ASCO|nr:uncharacterized protein AC631_02904 [Debaryomyces fabryi]KSA01339.1 hypothetical protein AC631_02904 [Debaryomyces fabryi]CUM46652.1 unnamed protein product [Debaryomyces fabryi]
MSGESDANLKQDATKKMSKSSTGKRKFHQKSRNGCLTCKKRRVKCDEQRPVCQKCQHMNLTCGYATNGNGGSQDEKDPLPINKKRKMSTGSMSPGSESNESSTQQETSSVSPAPNMGSKLGPGAEKIPGNLLNAGNLNNLNLSHLVNNLSGLGGGLNSLGNLASLTNLATLAQLPIDLSNLGSLIDSQIHSAVANNTANNMPYSNDSQKVKKQNESVNNNGINIKQEEGENQQSGPIPQQPGTQPQHSHPGEQHEPQPEGSGAIPNISPNVNTLTSHLTDNPLNNPMAGMGSSNLNMLDLRLMFHYTSQVASTITGAGISDTNIWNYDIPMLAFDHPFLMHSILAFSATHLSRTEKGLDQCVTCHRGDALRLLREAVLDINCDNTDALVASALILIMDSLANASFPLSTSPKSLPASAWIFHVKGAATILTAVWPLTETSRFYKFISVDLGDLGDIISQRVNVDPSKAASDQKFFTDLECHDSEIADLFPVEIDSPYLVTLAYLNKLHKERYKSDFILRIFAFPALLDKSFLSLLMTGDIKAMRIMRSYYKLLRSFTTEMKDKVWFLEGVSQVLPVDVEEYAGGAGGMHMMLDFLGGGPSIIDNEIDDEITKFDPSGSLTNRLIDTNNLPSDITSNLDVMQGGNGFMNIK